MENALQVCYACVNLSFETACSREVSERFFVRHMKNITSTDGGQMYRRIRLRPYEVNSPSYIINILGSRISREPIEIHHQNEIDLNHLCDIGAIFVKYGRRGKPNFRRIWISRDESKLLWNSPNGPLSEARFVELAHLKDIRIGRFSTANFRRYTIPKGVDSMCLSLIFPNRTVDLQHTSESNESPNVDIWIRYFAIRLLKSQTTPNETVVTAISSQSDFHPENLLSFWEDIILSHWGLHWYCGVREIERASRFPSQRFMNKVKAQNSDRSELKRTKPNNVQCRRRTVSSSQLTNRTTNRVTVRCHTLESPKSPILLFLWRLGIPTQLRHKFWPIVIGDAYKITEELFYNLNNVVGSYRDLLSKNNKTNVELSIPWGPYPSRVSNENLVIQAMKNFRKSILKIKPSFIYHSNLNCYIGYETRNNRLTDSKSSDSINLDISLDRCNFRESDDRLGEDSNTPTLIKAVYDIIDSFIVHRPDVGFSPGMIHVATVLSAMLPSVTDIFTNFVNLICGSFLNDFYRRNQHCIGTRTVLFQKLVRERLPLLALHFESLYLTPDVYLVPWFETVFTQILPKSAALIVFDRFLLQGESLMFQVALSILKYYQRQLHSSNFDDCVAILLPATNTNMFEEHVFTDILESPEMTVSPEIVVNMLANVRLNQQKLLFKDFLQ
eukprot:GHVL01018407.1.p1 GENE.GHVL01018407.1~~GHVL01018407.1.p1  ORF type:complete len:670 (+),score=108.32 GHVL01018407.1:779-2788(+)